MMKDHHRGPFSIDPFLRCFDTVQAVEVYENALTHVRTIPHHERETLQVEIARPSDDRYFVRIFCIREPAKDLWTSSSEDAAHEA